METFQLFKKAAWDLPPPLLDSPPTHRLTPPSMIDSQGIGAVTVSFFAFSASFSSFLPHQAEKIGKRQWEGVTGLSTASPRKKAPSAGSGELKHPSRALWKCLPWPPRGGSTDLCTSFPLCALAEPQGLIRFSFPVHTPPACCLLPTLHANWRRVKQDRGRKAPERPSRAECALRAFTESWGLETGAS